MWILTSLTCIWLSRAWRAADLTCTTYSQGELSSENLRSVCSAVGIQPERGKPESTNLVDKLILRRKDLRRLLDSFETTLNTVEELGKRSIQQLAAQHYLDSKGNVDDIRTQLVDHISSGECEVGIWIVPVALNVGVETTRCL